MKISVLGIGGTICMLKDSSGGVNPKLDAKMLVDSIGLNEDIKIEAKTILSLPSPSLSYNNLLEVLKIAKQEIKNGSNGVVVTQGTDTLEESAFLLSLFWDETAPLVITGAMKNPSEIGADGASNLYQAILVASSDEALNRGVLVAFNHTIYQPRFLHKSNAVSLETFVSINGGNVGYVYEKKVRFITPKYKNKIYKIPEKFTKKIAIIPACLGGDFVFLDYIKDFDGVVIDGFSPGAISFEAAKKLRELNPEIPIVVTSHARTTTYETYAYEGAEIYLQNQGYIMGGFFDCLKARLFLMLLLENGFSKEQIKDEFLNYYFSY